MVFLYPFCGTEDIPSVIRNYRMLLHGSGANAHSLRKPGKAPPEYDPSMALPPLLETKMYTPALREQQPKNAEKFRR